MLLGRVRAFNKKCNMALKEVTDMWVRVPNMETKGEVVAPLYMDRFVPRMLLGGESILSIIKIKEQTPLSEDSESVTTHKKSEFEENCPARYTDAVTWRTNQIAGRGKARIAQ